MDKKEIKVIDILEHRVKPSEMEGMLNLLTALQKSMLQILYESKTPMTIKEIRSSYILRLLNAYGYVAGLNPNQPQIIIPFTFDHNYNTNDLHKLFKTFVSLKERGETLAQMIDKSSKLLPKYTNSRPPSFKKIENEAKDLVSVGLVYEKPSNEKKAKAFYILQPKFYAYVKDHKIKLV